MGTQDIDRCPSICVASDAPVYRLGAELPSNEPRSTAATNDRFKAGNRRQSRAGWSRELTRAPIVSPYARGNAPNLPLTSPAAARGKPPIQIIGDMLRVTDALFYRHWRTFRNICNTQHSLPHRRIGRTAIPYVLRIGLYPLSSFLHLRMLQMLQSL